MAKMIIETPIIQDEYTEYVCEEYDIQDREKTLTEIPIMDLSELEEDKDWNIILLVGNSGSGKSTILRNIGELKKPEYNYDKCVISQFPNLSPKDASDLLCSVGLSSVPVWFHKPNELSNGERARLDICWHINNNEGIILIDEFTSVVNRDVAKSLSFALQRYIRQTNKKIILASCHFDLTEWLQPDYIFNLNKKDGDGNVEFEKLVYADDKNYEAYKNINDNDILSDSRNVE